jgi:hypothetical protein
MLLEKKSLKLQSAVQCLMKAFEFIPLLTPVKSLWTVPCVCFPVMYAETKTTILLNLVNLVTE